MNLVKVANNFHVLQWNGKEVWFSYETPIAYNDGVSIWVSQNEWSRTTGKHLNHIDRDKERRITHRELLNILRGGDIYE